MGPGSPLGFAARHGHLDALKWLRANGCKWTSYLLTNAALGGHLHVVLQWAREQGCTWADVVVHHSGCEMDSSECWIQD